MELPSEGTSASEREGPAATAGDPVDGKDSSSERVCCGIRRSRLWGALMWSTYINLFVCLPRLIILPGLFINIVRGPVYGFFVHPLWALLYCIFTAFLVLSRDNPAERVLADPFGIAIALEPRCGRLLEALRQADVVVAVSRKTAAILTLVWIFVDFIFTVLTLGISLGFSLIVFTETDGLITTGFYAEYAVLMVGIIFCGVSVLCEIITLCSAMLFLCSGCGHAPSGAELNRSHPSASPSGQEQLATSDRHLGVIGADTEIHDDSDGGVAIETSLLCQKINACSVYYILAVSITSIVFLSFCIHDSLRGEYYQSEADADYELCDGLVPIRCALPFPSSYWLKEDLTTSTGYKVS